MKTIVLTILFAVLLAAAPSVSAAGQDGNYPVQKTLARLDSELARRDIYISARRARIDSLKAVSASRTLPVDRRLAVLLEIGDNYNAFQADSALMFYQSGFVSARAAGLDSAATLFALRRATYLPLVQLFEHSRFLFDSIRAAGVPEGLRAEAADAERQMLFYTAHFYTDIPQLYDSIMARQFGMQEALIPLLPEGSPRRVLNMAENALYHHDVKTVKTLLLPLLDTLDEDTPMYATASHALSEACAVTGDTDGRIYYLALSAIADTRCATLEVTSLQELGNLLHERGDIDRAYNYLSIALRNAVDCHAALRIIQTSKSIPLIGQAYQDELRTGRHRIYVVIAVMALLLIVLAVTGWLIRSRNSQLAALTTSLAEANRTKDVYIAQFLNLCSIYMDKLNQFNKLVNRKLTNGKADELQKLTKSGKLVEEQSKEFYEVFDDAFLHLYPDFVPQVNALLEPDKRIELRPDEKLNTDLRIIALMRLGIDDSSRIARMLNYSVYTIYTYRNKFKSRALNRDTFEKDIMAIRAVRLTADEEAPDA